MSILLIYPLFDLLTDYQRKKLLVKITEDDMLPKKLRDPDENHTAHTFHILMERNKSAHNWANLYDIINILQINDISEEETNIVLYVIRNYITEIYQEYPYA
jgi:hypothetical protein